MTYSSRFVQGVLACVFAGALTACGAGAITPAVRVIVVQPKVDLAYCETYQSYRDHLVGLVQAQVVPKLVSNRPNLVVFPEDVGLPAVFIGSRGTPARSMDNVGGAYGALFSGTRPPYGNALYYYMTAMPDLPLDRLPALAVTDTVWRSFFTTMREIAVTTGAWVIASTNVSGKVEASIDPMEGYLLSDPDLPPGPVYVARDPEVYNTAFVFSPAGDVVGAARKPYITDLEESLRFSYGPISEVAPLDLGFAKLGIATCKDGWMPDVMDRLDMMGANVLVLPTGYGGWTIPDDAAHPEVWMPDIFAQCGWQDVMKYASLRFGLTSHLTGNLFDLPFDGQSAVLADPVPGVTSWAYVGQDPSPGFLAVAPWIVDDPGKANPGLSLAERRAELRQAGIALLPGLSSANGYVETAVAADIAPNDPYPVIPGAATGAFGRSVAIAPSAKGEQSYASVASNGAGFVVVAWQDTRDGRQQVFAAVSTDGGKRFSTARRVSASPNPQRTPSVVVSPSSVYVAWQEESAGGRRIMVSRGAANSSAFGKPKALPATGTGDQWGPALAWGWGEPDRLERGPRAFIYIAYVETIDGNERIRVARAAESGSGWNIVSADSTPLPFPAPNIRNNQWSPAIDVRGRQVAVAWVDFRDYAWDVRVARSLDGARSFVPPVRADDAGTTFERIHNNPDVLFADDGALLCAWTDIRNRVPNATARVSRGLGPNRILAATAALGASSWRPRLAPLGRSRVVAAWQDFRTHGNDILVALSKDNGKTFGAELRVDDGGNGPSYQYAPVVASINQQQAIVVWEDTRTGLRQLRCTCVK